MRDTRSEKSRWFDLLFFEERERTGVLQVEGDDGVCVRYLPVGKMSYLVVEMEPGLYWSVPLLGMRTTELLPMYLILQ